MPPKDKDYALMVSVLIGVVIGSLAVSLHVRRGGLKRSTWSSGMELLYSMVGVAVIGGQFLDPVKYKVYTTIVASIITSYHLILSLLKV